VNKSPRRTLAVMTAAAALAGGTALAGTASAAPQQPSGSQARQLQQQVDSYLAKDSGARQISANKVAFKGGTVTFHARGEADSRASSAPSCRHGHLCIVDGRGQRYDYYRCGTYNFYGIGNGTFNNNQTSGTVARFYNRNGSLRWTNRAKDTGTASWTPVWKIKPC
jgi:outer membrane murein-binding lipoprotein Lpp